MKSNQIIKNFTSKNYKAYLLFLILTFILWFIIQLTKTYNYKDELSVQLTNVPKYIVLDSSKQTLEINLKANGLKLWKYGISSQVLDIDYDELKKDTNRLTISTDKIKNITAEKYEFDIEDITLDKMLLSYNYKKKKTKKVPLRSRIDLNFANGYNTIDSLKLIPDSVTISGSASDIGKINFILTDKVKINDVSDTLRGKASLEKPMAKVEISSNLVDYYLPVEKFSEKALMVDITTINIPDSLELNIFPDQAKVSFLVALKSFDKVSKMDFNVICDYNERYQEDAIMIPKLVEAPDNVLNPKLHIRKIDYLIKKLQ